MPAVDTYIVTHISKNPTVDATIICRGAGVTVGTLSFVKDGATLPANIPGPPLTLHFPTSRFNDVINTLRFEKPLQLNINPVNLIGTIGTGQEPVGEEEGV